MTTNRMRRALVAVAATGLLALTACGGGGGGGNTLGPAVSGVDLSGTTISVGSKEFTEQRILGAITVQALRAAGATVDDHTGLVGTPVVRQALTSGQIGMYWEYTGTAWLGPLGNTNPIPDEKGQFDAKAMVGQVFGPDRMKEAVQMAADRTAITSVIEFA